MWEFKVTCWSPAYIDFASTGNMLASFRELLSPGDKILLSCKSPFLFELEESGLGGTYKMWARTPPHSCENFPSGESQFPLIKYMHLNISCTSKSEKELLNNTWCVQSSPNSIKVVPQYSLLFCFIMLFFKNIFYWLCYYTCPIFPPSLHSILHTPSLPHSPKYSSCPWVIHISSLASTFPTLFLPSPCLFSTNHLCYLFSVPFLLLSPSHSPVDNPPCDLHSCGSVPVLVVCLVCFCFVLGVAVNNCQFAVIFPVHIFLSYFS